MTIASDLVGETYWSTLWSSMESFQPIDVDEPSLLNHMNRQFDDWFARFLGAGAMRGGDFLEVGCARSAWLPYFGRRLGLRVHGLDYSEIGCRQAEEVLRRAAVTGEIRHGDMFAPPADWSSHFDVVMSWGLIEHFEDTSAAIRAVAHFAKPGGLVITIVPNMVGSVGLLQKLLNRPVFDLHRQLSAAGLRRAAEAAGLEILDNRWFGVSNYWVANLNGLDPSTVGFWVKRQLLRAACAVSVGLWAVERRLGPLPAVGAFAPYVVSISRRPPAG